MERCWWILFQRFACPNINAIRTAMDAVRSALINVIQRKQAQPARGAVLSETEGGALADWLEMAAIITNYMAAIGPINAAIAARKRTAGTVNIRPIERRIAALNARKKRYEPTVVSAFVLSLPPLRVKMKKKGPKSPRTEHSASNQSRF